jgi:hypothetical protein
MSLLRRSCSSSLLFCRLWKWWLSADDGCRYLVYQWHFSEDNTLQRRFTWVAFNTAVILIGANSPNPPSFYDRQSFSASNGIPLRWRDKDNPVRRATIRVIAITAKSESGSLFWGVWIPSDMFWSENYFLRTPHLLCNYSTNSAVFPYIFLRKISHEFNLFGECHHSEKENGCETHFWNRLNTCLSTSFDTSNEWLFFILKRVDVFVVKLVRLTVSKAALNGSWPVFTGRGWF